MTAGRSGQRFALAVAAAAAVVLSAPFQQQAFTAIAERWPQHDERIILSATAIPAGVACLVALWRIRERRLLRYLLVALGLGLGAYSVLRMELAFTETFHFTEYGVLALLFYRVWRPVEDGSTLILPLLAGTLAGTFDEWFQWFIPIRAGEARDVLINIVGTVCGLLIAVGLDLPARLTLRLRPESRRRVVLWSAGAVLVYAAFFYTVHVGHVITDAEIGSFRSRFTPDTLASVNRDRTSRWRERPPVDAPRLSREDQYLAEGQWRVSRRNDAWEAGDVTTAWRENRILEKFYPAILDMPTPPESRGHRWPPAQRADAAARAGERVAPLADREYRYSLYVLPGLF